MRFLLPHFTGYLLLLLLPSWVLAQSVAGVWMGRLIQDGGGPFADYRLRLDLQQQGSTVTGTAFIHVAQDPDLFGKMQVEGKVVGDVFTFRETALLNSRHDDAWGWCLKHGTLSLKQVGDFRRMEGRWEGEMEGTPCAPGTVALEMLNVQPKVAPAPAPVKAEPERVGSYGVVAGREITHRKDVPVYTRHLTLYIWDGDKVDGDIISLQYNGKWLLQKYAITKEKRKLEVEVVEGLENSLILYAENEGQYPPNTAAVTFWDGKQERNLSLSSNKSTCGALKFVVTQ